jgi:hypothetical protein
MARCSRAFMGSQGFGCVRVRRAPNAHLHSYSSGNASLERNARVS